MKGSEAMAKFDKKGGVGENLLIFSPGNGKDLFAILSHTILQ